MEDAVHFFAMDRWQLSADGVGAENGGGNGQLDELGLSGGHSDQMMGFMSPSHGLTSNSLPLLGMEGLPHNPEAPLMQDWAFSNGGGWNGFAKGVQPAGPLPPMSTYNLLPSKVILPPPGQPHNSFTHPQLPPYPTHMSQPSRQQVANVKAGGGAANHNMDLERGSRNSTEALTRGGGGTSSRDSKRPCNPSAKRSQREEDDVKDPAYIPYGASKSRHKRPAAKSQGATPEDDYDPMLDAEVNVSLGSPFGPIPDFLSGDVLATLLPPASTRKPQRQAATDNPFCPDPVEPKGKGARNPRTKSSNYRGVTKHRRSGRYEAHLWIRELHRQVYLGGYEHEEHAAEAYDVAALKSKGLNVKTNFDISRYSDLTACMHSISLEELIMAVRRQSQGFSRGSSTYRGVTHHPSAADSHSSAGRWEARIGIPGSKHIYLGLHDDEDGAAHAYDSALVRLRGMVAATNFSLSDYRAELADYHRKQQELLEKREDTNLCSGEAFEDWIKNGYRDGATKTAAKKQLRRSARNAALNQPPADSSPAGEWQDMGEPVSAAAHDEESQLLENGGSSRGEPTL